jgi:DNA-binding SARP family transcriptional activator
MNDARLLEISTLGGLSIRLAGESVSGLASRKVEALLVYLACSGRAQRREVLAELFWEERTQSQAMSNLRVALSSLRKQLGPYVTITRDTVGVNPEKGVWLDMAELEAHLSAGRLEEAVALYQGGPGRVPRAGLPGV